MIEDLICVAPHQTGFIPQRIAICRSKISQNGMGGARCQCNQCSFLLHTPIDDMIFFFTEQSEQGSSGVPGEVDSVGQLSDLFFIEY